MIGKVEGKKERKEKSYSHLFTRDGSCTYTCI